MSFFMFTTFTDRDGKMQLEALAQSGFDPLARTTRFMLTEKKATTCSWDGPAWSAWCGAPAR